jgi:uncharacterized protein YjeT (DUF2065 family)
MDSQSYRAILRRVGVVLLVIGVADIGWMVYCIVNDISYRSSLNLFAVIAGILLIRGNLRAAATIRWFGVFFVAAGLTLFFTWPALQPMVKANITVAGDVLTSDTQFDNRADPQFGSSEHAVLKRIAGK